MTAMENNTSSQTNGPASPNSAHTTRIARRDFLRACALAGAGLASDSHRKLANAMLSWPVGGKAPTGNIQVGLDIGSSKVCAAVGELLADGTIKILGIGQAPSRGVTAHGIVDGEAASACVSAALVDAEIQCDVMIRNVVLAVPGTEIFNYETTDYYIDLDQSEWKELFEWEKICYAASPDGSIQPVTLADHKHARHWPIVFGPDERRIQDSIRCVEDVGVQVERIVFAPAASSEAVLSANQKKLGALVIDIGGGTTDLAIYYNGALVLSVCVPVGGRHIANELALTLGIPLAEAERLKIMESTRRRDAIPDEGFLRKQREMIHAIVQYRLEEIFDRVKRRLASFCDGIDSLCAGVHLIGGCALDAGICEVAEKVLGLPAQRACAKGLSGPARFLANPGLACALGLAKLGHTEC